MKIRRPILIGVLLLPGLLSALHSRSANAQNTGAIAAAHKPLSARLAWKRSSPLDLEIGGDLFGLLPHEFHNTRYITREQLLALPQVNFTVTSDANFNGPTEISGLPLDQLIEALFPEPDKSILVVAICSDKYQAHYPKDYIAAHHPVLVLKINGKDPAEWPKAPGGYFNMGPYVISSADFKPSFKILSYEDEPQIPWGVVRLDFRTEAKVLLAIQPRMPGAVSREEQDGFRIAQQNCFRCHNSELEGGMKAFVSWNELATLATLSPGTFQAYIHDPKSKTPNPAMPGFPNYDEATLRALTKYFQTFSDDTKSKKP